MISSQEFPLTLLRLFTLFTILLLVSCSSSNNPTETALPTREELVASEVPTAQIVPTLTLTPVPLALRINGSEVTLAEFDVQIIQLEMAALETGQELSAEEIQQKVVDYFIEMELLAQAAVQEGYSPNPDTLAQKMNHLIQAAGGDAAFQDWLSIYGYTEDLFRITFQRELAAVWQRDKLIETVGETAEQIHARQILVYDEELAQQIYRQLQGGADFATLAESYDPTIKGELGWFPRGYLFVPEIEQAVFNIQPGQYTEVIHTSFGYHIVQVIERELERPLSDDARQVLMHQMLTQWLSNQREQSSIEILLP